MQNALKTFLDSGALLAHNDHFRQSLSEKLESDLAEQHYRSATQDVVKIFQREWQLQPTGEVDQATAKAINGLLEEQGLLEEPGENEKFVVRGTVRFEDGSPSIGVVVLAFDRDMRHEELLGEAETDENGAYDIPYSRDQFHRAEKKRADLQIRVMDDNGSEIAASDIVFNAEPIQTIDLTLTSDQVRGIPGTSEWERYLEELIPLIENVPLAELEDEELQFLSRETGIHEEHLRFVRLDGEWRQQRDLDRAVFYGLLRQGLPTSYRRLLAEKSARLREALEASIEQNMIPVHMSDVDSVLERLEELAVEAAFEADNEAPEPPLGAVLATAPDLPQEMRRRFVAFALRYDSDRQGADDFWVKLREETDFSDEAVRTTQFTIGLGALSRYVPLVERLQQERQQGRIRELRHLARLTVDDWRGHVAEVGFPADTPGESEDEKVWNYALHLTRAVETAFPTTAVAYKLGRADRLEMPFKQEISRFLLETPGFDLGQTNINAYLAEHPAPEGIEDPEAFKQELKRLQRVFKLSLEHNRFETMHVLMESGLDSAHGVVALGMDRVVRSHGEALGGERRAIELVNRAEHIVAKVQMLSMWFGREYHRITLPVMADPAGEAARIPELAELFGSLSFCECEHCRSVYSPAAYLVDLLEFVGEGRAIERQPDGTIVYPTITGEDGRTREKNALDVLFERRGNLGEIELSCENTNVPVPYIDLVNEILEDAIAPPPAFTPFDLDNARTSDLDNRNLSDALKAAFTPPLSDNAQISVEESGGWWRIDEPAFTYTIRKQDGSAPRVMGRSRQTRGAPRELRTQPQYVNTEAYSDTLKQAVFPWNLPFDLWTAESRVFLDHLGASRHDLMEVVHEGGVPSAQLYVASERMDLTTLERELITGSSTSEPHERWGLKATGNVLPDLRDPSATVSLRWVDALRRVPVFLEQSGLSFDQLTELLKTEYINPGGAMSVEFPPAETAEEAIRISSCDLTKATLRLPSEDPSAAAVLDRIQRFVRLQGKLNWSFRELDAALRALPPYELTDGFLVQLAHVVQLQADLQVPVLEILSWWSSIDTVRFGDQPSLYEKLFLGKVVSDPPDVDFRLNSDGDELVDSTGLIEDHKPTILAVLEITDKELSLLVEQSLPDDALNLGNLSALYRSVSLARALKLSIDDFIRIRRLVSTDPFDPADPSKAGLFVRNVEKIRASGFSVPELDYSLRHEFPLPSPVAPTETEAGRVLEDIRNGLQKIEEEQTFSPESTDRLDELLQAKLALLNRDQTIIEQLIATFNDAIVYTAPLATLPVGFTLPPALRDKVHYVPDAAGMGELRFTGVMTTDEQRTLLSLLSDVAYPGVVDSLFNAPRQFVSRHMRWFVQPHYAASLPALPAGFAFPRELKGRVYHDPSAGEIRSIGALTEAETETLTGLLPGFEVALNDLFNAPDTFVPDAEEDVEEFLTAADISTLIDRPVPPDATPERARKSRFKLVLDKLMPYLRDQLSENLVVQRLGDALGLELEVTEPLLDRWLTLPSDSTKPALCAFLDYREDCRPDPSAPVFAESSPHVSPTAETFPEVFQTYSRLHKAALVAKRFDLTRTQLSWLFEYGPEVGWLDLNALPLAPTGSAATTFDAWQRLADLVRLCDEVPVGEEMLDDLLSQAHAVAPDAPEDTKDNAKEGYLEALSAWTDWTEADLETLLGDKDDYTATGRLDAVFPNAYRDESLLMQLTGWFRLLKRVGVSAGQMALWGQADMTRDIARSIRQAAKAKHERERWYTIAPPLQDELRKRQRRALVAYLVAHGSQNGDHATFEDANDLSGRYLVDVEMDPCMMTSRIKQANSSVQLFVQRSLMNLESEVELEPENARQWRTWMKNYRVWEANRKVFLYPENWIEPELRDDKSPFFEDLENALLQNEVREDTVENAFLAYLERLDEVARLEVAGMYHQEEDGIDILHVFGRTRNTPNVYYYRQWVDQSYWTPWERVDVDIQGDHLIPVVWNRRLHLFWPIFTEKAKDPGTVSDTETGAPPEKYWEIQLAWSEQKNRKWLAKKVSPVLLTTELSRYQRTFRRYYFRTSPQRDGSLVIVVYEARSGVPFPEPPVLYTQEIRSLGAAAVFETSSRRFVRSSEVLLKPLGSRVDRMKFKELEQDRLELRILGGSRTLLGKTPGRYSITPLHQRWDFLPPDPFFYEDDTRTFFADWERVVTPVRIERWGEVYELAAVSDGYR
ncbi:MAG: neuraminidase-like domain-containing protein, partial [Gammaproteobacteria bacterium]